MLSHQCKYATHFSAYIVLKIHLMQKNAKLKHYKQDSQTNKCH